MPTACHQMLQLIRDVRKIGQQRPVDGLVEAVHDRTQLQGGEIVYYKDEKAEEMAYIVSGRFRLVESGLNCGWRHRRRARHAAPSKVRTQTVDASRTA